MKAKSVGLCRDCRFFNSDQEECRNGPPTVQMIKQPKTVDVETAWPSVSETDWCGGFSSKPRSLRANPPAGRVRATNGQLRMNRTA